MSMKKFVFLLLIFSLQSFAQDKMPETELLVRRFIHAMIDKNPEQIRALSLDHHNLKALWQGEKKSKEEADQLKRELAKLDIDWLKEGDSFRFASKVFTVNENMISKRHQIARVKMVEYGFPIHLSKVGGAWYIQPLFIVNIFQRDLFKKEKETRKNYTVTIDGKEIALNENEPGSITLPNGQKLKLSLRKNLFQNLNDQYLKLSYSRDLKVQKTRENDYMIYRLKGELSPSIMVQVYPKSNKLAKTRGHVISSIIENYRSMDYTLEQKPVRPAKIYRKGQVIEGQDIYSKRNDIVHIDRFFFWEEDKAIVGVVLQMELTDSTAGNDFVSHIINELEVNSSPK